MSAANFLPLSSTKPPDIPSKLETREATDNDARHIVRTPHDEAAIRIHPC